MLASEIRPFLLLDGVPGVAGVRPPLDGVRLEAPPPGVDGVTDRPCALPCLERPVPPLPLVARWTEPALAAAVLLPPGVRGVLGVLPTLEPELLLLRPWPF